MAIDYKDEASIIVNIHREKIDKIEVLFHQFKSYIDSKILFELIGEVHDLCNSANIYNNKSLEISAENLKTLLSSMSENLPLRMDDKIYHAQVLLYHLKSSLDNVIHYELSDEIICLFESDIEWAKKLSVQLINFKYKIKIFNNMFLLQKYIEKNNVEIIIININLLNSDLEKNISILKHKNLNKLHIFYIANSGEFSLRLKAVRAYGEVFLIKPFIAEELVEKLDIFLLKDDQYRILIINNDLSVAENYAIILSHANMKSYIITSPTQVNHALSEFKPDLILIDIYMPECNGLELTSIIRQQNSYENIPIIYLSNIYEDELKQLNAMSVGGDDFVMKSIPPDQLILKIKNKVKRYKSLCQMVTKDYLTRVLNYSNIQDQVKINIKLANRLNSPLSIVLISIDCLKKINDNYGFDAGDQVLKSMCLLLRHSLRTTDIIGRYGDNEFLIILPNTTLESAKYMMEELRKHFLELSHQWNGETFFVTFSAGIAGYPQFKNSVYLIQAAEQALLKAKKCR